MSTFKSIAHKITSVLSVLILIATAFGLWKSFRAIDSNDYVSKKMFRIASIVLHDHWNDAVWMTLVAGVLVGVVLFLAFSGWRLLFANAFEFKEPARLKAIGGAAAILLLGALLLLMSGSLFRLPFLIAVSMVAGIVAWLQIRNRFLANLVSSAALRNAGYFTVSVFLLLKIAVVLDQHQNRPEKPNIVWIVIDTLRADHLGCYGYDKATSPNLDQLAAQSVLFKNAFSQESYTKASAASYFSSTYPFVNRTLYSHPRMQLLDNRFTTLAEVLRNENYLTFGVGYNVQLEGVEQGFDIFHFWPREQSRRTDFSQDPKSIHEQTKKYLGSTSSRPVFLYLHYMDVHAPYGAPEPHRKQFWSNDVHGNSNRYKKRSFDFSKEEANKMIALYDSGIHYADASVAEMIRSLSGYGIDPDHTIFIVSSDHGEDFYDAHPEDPGGIEHWRTLYREMIHVPLILSFPGVKAAVIEESVELLDIVPTILDLAGIERREVYGFQGNTLAPLIHGSGGYKDVVLAGGNRGRLAIIAEDWKYYRFETKCKESKFWCRRPPAHLKNLSWGEQLFHLRSDFSERTDLFDSNSEKVAFFRQILGSVLKESEDFTPPTISLDEQKKEQLRGLGYLDH